MYEMTCPGCGETDALRGEDVDGHIEVTCQRCGACWRRGDPRCRLCGGSALVTGVQRMTRHPRGTLLAVIGSREIPLCPTCDAEVIGPHERRTEVPDGYVSRFVRGRSDSPTPRPAERPRPVGPSKLRGPLSTVRPTPLPRPPRTTASTAPAEPTDPTLRQATERFLESQEPTSSVALVLLGQLLGASARLSTVDSARTAGRIADWVTRTWRPGADRDAAVTTVRAAVTFWRERGWLTEDLAADLE